MSSPGDNDNTFGTVCIDNTETRNFTAQCHLYRLDHRDAASHDTPYRDL